MRCVKKSISLPKEEEPLLSNLKEVITQLGELPLITDSQVVRMGLQALLSSTPNQLRTYLDRCPPMDFGRPPQTHRKTLTQEEIEQFFRKARSHELKKVDTP